MPITTSMNHKRACSIAKAEIVPRTKAIIEIYRVAVKALCMNLVQESRLALSETAYQVCLLEFTGGIQRWTTES